MKQTTCTCSAYTFPHRQNGGQCRIGDLMDILDEAHVYADTDTAVDAFDTWGNIYDAAHDLIAEARTPHPASIRY